MSVHIRVGGQEPTQQFNIFVTVIPAERLIEKVSHVFQDPEAVSALKAGGNLESLRGLSDSLIKYNFL